MEDHNEFLELNQTGNRDKDTPLFYENNISIGIQDPLIPQIGSARNLESEFRETEEDVSNGRKSLDSL